MAVFKGKMSVSASEFYLTILSMMAEEIAVKTDKTVSVDVLEKGYKYKYKKQVGKKSSEASVHIRQPIKDKQIITTYHLNNQQYEMAYQINSLSEEEIEVIYTQTGGNADKGIAAWLFKRNMKKRFDQIEAYIKKNRKK